MSSTPTQSTIQSTLPPLPPANGVPWSAEVIQAHRGLTSAFGVSYRALNLDESDPIRLGHHLKQVETFMTSVIGVLGTYAENPLPPKYIDTVGGAIESLADGLRDALGRATSALVTPLHRVLGLCLQSTKVKGRMYPTSQLSPQRGVVGAGGHGR